MATTAVAVASALSSWLMENLDLWCGIIRFIGTAAAAGTSVLLFLIKLRKWLALRAPFKRPADIEEDDLP